MDLITDIYTLEDLSALPRPLLQAMINSEVEDETLTTHVLDALHVMDDVLRFITDVEWVNAPVSILSSTATIMLDAAGQVLGEW